MPTTKPSPATPIYQLKITLRDIRPPIWRRIQVPGDLTLGQLHRVLQIALDWSDSHLHQFKIGGAFYGVPDPDYDMMGPPMRDEKRVRLNTLLCREKDKMIYEYDFGDGWEHDIVLEKILPRQAGVHYPICLTGKRACPPEDCGGVGGYEMFLEAIQDPEHPEHDEMLEWVGGEFDPEAFDLEVVNRALKSLK
jgi:hypothetical protein